MKGKVAYTITTALYGLVGYVSIYFFIGFSLQRDGLLSTVALAMVLVAFDNVWCESRKKRYLE